jgi:transcriptional regulator with XRE-family HTH domain
MQPLADNLRHARERLGLSQLQAETLTDIGHKTLSNYENDVSSPNPEALVKICNAYNISADTLLGRRPISEQSLSPNEQYLVNVFRNLTQEGRSFLLQTAKAAATCYPLQPKAEDINGESK